MSAKKNESLPKKFTDAPSVTTPLSKAEAEFLRSMIRTIGRQKLGELELVQGQKKAMDKLSDPAFMNAAYAYFQQENKWVTRGHRGYGDAALNALQTGDIGFFKSTIDAIETILSKKRPPVKKQDSPPDMIVHLAVAQTLANDIKNGTMPEPTIAEFNASIIKVLDRIGAKSFEDEKSWRKIRNHVGLKLKQSRTGPVQKASGKGRSYDGED